MSIYRKLTRKELKQICKDYGKLSGRAYSFVDSRIDSSRISTKKLVAICEAGVPDDMEKCLMVECIMDRDYEKLDRYLESWG